MEFFYDNSQEIKIITPNLYNVLEIKNIIDSIIWQYARISERLVRFKFPLEYKNKSNKQTLQIFDNKVIYQDDKQESEANFSLEFIISNTKKDSPILDIFSFSLFVYRNLYLPNYPTKIWITPSHDSQKIKFGSTRNYIEICEMVYLKLLSWKFTNGFLLDKTDLIYLQKNQAYKKPELNLGEIENDFKTFKISQDLIQPFEKVIDKNEKILFVYFPKNFFLKMVLFFFIFFIILIISNYILELVFGYSFGLFILIFTLLVVVILISASLLKTGNYLFTSQKMIVKFGKKICFAFYSDISKIICNLEKNRECIEIYFKNKINGDCIKREIEFLEILPPNSLKIFEKLKYLILSQNS